VSAIQQSDAVHAPSTVIVSPDGLSAQAVVAVARHDAVASLSSTARAAMERSRAVVERLARGSDPIYGISTGFGALANIRISVDRQRELQHALIRSHAAGMGAPVEREVVRAMMLLRARTLAMGYSGTRPLVADALLALLAAGITPVVPEHGSLGCSGDLAPLAHVALCLIGEGEAVTRAGRKVSGAEVMRIAGLDPIALEPKEGLALINGTDGILGMLVLACEDLHGLLVVADITAAMSVEALMGTDGPFSDAAQLLRPHPGQAVSAANLRRLLAASGIAESHRGSAHAIQDAYSMRCSPQVAGAARDTLEFATTVAGRELRSAVDNPAVLDDGTVASNGNFHGAPLGFACDFLAIAAAEVGAIAERRIDRLLDPARSQGLPAFLAPDPGANSGVMIAQYTAASLVAEDRRLAAPASVDSIPTSAMQEDHVSMAWAAARKLRTVVANVGKILAIELVCAGRALDLRAPLDPGPASAAARDLLREVVDGPGPDRPLSPELERAEALVRSGALLARVREVVDLA
jgi:histidine ammonia-lyase